VLLLVDWGFAAREGDKSFRVPKGTPFTMSQKTLQYCLEESGDGYVYTAADELEAAAKSLLLILLPSLKRCIQQQVDGVSRHRRRETSADSLAVLKQCWEDVLSATPVLALCARCDYDGLVDWFVTNQLLFWRSHTEVDQSCSFG